MEQQGIELILTKTLASKLDLPMFVVDPTGGHLLYFNPAAERALGLQFAATGPMPMTAWATEWFPRGDDGAQVEPEQLPLVRTLRDRRPHMTERPLWITSARDKVVRRIEIAAIPLIGESGNFVGAAAIFWEVPPE